MPDQNDQSLPPSALEFIRSNVPPEHLKWIDGKLCVDELGMIHLATAWEQLNPDDPRIRAGRYYLQKIAHEARQ